MPHPFKHPLASHAAGTVLGRRRNGSPIYPIAGGNGEGEGGSASGQDGSGESGTSGQQGDGATGQGGQATGQSGPGTSGDGTDWKAMARQWEKRAKENSGAQTELEKIRAANMSEQEKAVTAAEKAGRTAALSEAAPLIAQAKLEAAAALAGVDLTTLAEYIDLKRFVDKDGQVDDTAIKKAVTTFAKLAPARGAGRSGGDMGGGSGSGDQAASIDKQIADATAKRDFATVIRLKRQKAAQT
ncbi:hypothetical protein [Streptomyces albipurpureus]|uniref:Scaffolding protein n=1 Tax=Streptomyces albipurpureus TaxID=2897419 RepID=A0ABT0V0P0_9ACTN|nr:hypothetical protein [Streptomyces sp. CWNU-1]MCM2394354.1 hypothetical protein [Streptomyces sp. CWNU-1]